MTPGMINTISPTATSAPTIAADTEQHAPAAAQSFGDRAPAVPAECLSARVGGRHAGHHRPADRSSPAVRRARRAGCRRAVTSRRRRAGRSARRRPRRSAGRRCAASRPSVATVDSSPTSIAAPPSGTRCRRTTVTAAPRISPIVSGRSGIRPGCSQELRRAGSAVLLWAGKLRQAHPSMVPRAAERGRARSSCDLADLDDDGPRSRAVNTPLTCGGCHHGGHESACVSGRRRPCPGRDADHRAARGGFRHRGGAGRFQGARRFPGGTSRPRAAGPDAARVVRFGRVQGDPGRIRHPDHHADRQDGHRRRRARPGVRAPTTT